MQATLGLLAEGVRFIEPSQFGIEVNTQVFERVSQCPNPGCSPGGVGCGCLAEDYHHLFCFSGVEEKVVLLIPLHKYSNDSSLGNTCHLKYDCIKTLP